MQQFKISFEQFREFTWGEFPPNLRSPLFCNARAQSRVAAVLIADYSGPGQDKKPTPSCKTRPLLLTLIIRWCSRALSSPSLACWGIKTRTFTPHLLESSSCRNKTL
ncbi:hypothetical protein J6590_016804 [Homalodisca vitripennis]|nr:hypothetical protein J6590_016804 [Homalodisca vitripennis]